MLVKGVFTQISGSVGGVTGSHNSGGMYLRARAIPTDPGTLRQVIMRAIVAFLAARWRDTLTAGQRAGWETYATNTPITGPLGDPRVVGGLPMYIRANSVRLQISESVIDSPPATGLPALNVPTNIVLSNSTGLLSFDLAADPWVDLNDAFLVVYASRPLSPALNFFKGPYRLIDSVEGDSVAPPSAFSGDYEAIWGPVAQGEQVRIQLRVADELGRLSAPLRESVIVT